MADWSGPSHLLAVVPCGGSYHEHATECRSHHLTNQHAKMAVAQLKSTNHGKHAVSAMDLDYVDELVTESHIIHVHNLYINLKYVVHQ